MSKASNSHFSSAIFSSAIVLLLTVLTGCQNEVFAPTVVPDANSAVVYLYRPAATGIGLAKPKVMAYPEVFVDGTTVGEVRYDKYISFRVAPGKHTIRVTGLTPGAKDWEFRDNEQTFTAEANDKIFYKLKVEFNNVDASPLFGMKYYYHFVLVKPDEAQYEIRFISPQRL